MFSVTLLCVGKMKEKFFVSAFEEYRKRLGAFCHFELVEIPEQRLSENPAEKEIQIALGKEASEIERHIPSGAAVVAMCVEGMQKSSPALAEQLNSWANHGYNKVCFIVGGSFGLSEEIKQRADLRLSFSQMTFPHHLFRVMLAEQIYRAFSIMEGSRYHK